MRPATCKGWRAFCDVKQRLRDALRPAGDGDLWIGRPRRATSSSAGSAATTKLARCCSNGRWSNASSISSSDERLQSAYLGQGVIGTFASPHDPGTASIHFHHQSGRLGGMPGMWGYVEGGMGMVSFILCDIARDAGAVVLTGRPGRPDHPRRRGRARRGRADRVAVRRLERRPAGDAAPAGRRRRSRLASAGRGGPAGRLHGQAQRRAQASCPASRPGPGPACRITWARSTRRSRRTSGNRATRPPGPGELPERLWTELYFQTAHDPSVAPAGVHTMSVFAQYVPHTFARGDWDSRRDEVKELAIRSIARFCDNIPAAVIDVQVLGPPDIEREVGLTGGHIFQGECLPAYMWDQRLTPRTPMPGVFLCGACTYPGGSVIAHQRPQRGDGDPGRGDSAVGPVQTTSRKYSSDCASGPRRDRPWAPSRAASLARVMSGLRRLGSSWGRSS